MTKLLEWSADEASGDALDYSGNGRSLSFTSNNVSRVASPDATGLQQSAAGVTLGPAVAGLATAIRSMTLDYNLKASFTGWAMEFYRSTALSSPNDTGIWGLLCLGGALMMRVKNPSNTPTDIALPTNLNTWKHLGVRFDGTRLWVYHEGTLVNTGGTLISGGLWTVADVFRVFDNSAANLAIDNVRLYDNDIGEAGVLADMATPAGAAPVDEGTLDGSFSSPSAALTGDASATADLSGSFSSPATDISAAASASGQVDASFASPDATFSVRSGTSGDVVGSFSAPTFSASGGIPLPDRDILFTVEPGTRSGYSIEVGPPRTTVAEGDTQRTQIGAGDMDSQWRKGSKQFADFVVTLLDPEGELTQAEVEAMPFQVLVAPGLTTPALDDVAWTDPSVPKAVSTVNETFRVAIMHMFQATATGIHGVWVKFGPSPEEPLYLAATFVVL